MQSICLKLLSFIATFVIANASNNGATLDTSYQMTASSSTTQTTDVQKAMLEMVQKSFGDSKWKLAMADGIFTKSLLQIMASLQNDVTFHHQVSYESELQIKSVLLWRKIYELATTQWHQAMHDLTENTELTTAITNSINTRNDYQKQVATQIFDAYLLSTFDSMSSSTSSIAQTDTTNTVSNLVDSFKLKIQSN
eukprot:430239_1